MDNLKKKAEAFSLSYKAAMELSLDSTTSRAKCAEALAGHYKPGMMAFTFGNISKIEDAWPGATAEAVVEKHLENFEKSGLGWKIHLEKYEVVPYSEGSAQCWLTWTIEPKNGVEGRSWTNIYAFRLPPSGEGEGSWEYTVSDHELGELLKRYPNFFSQ